MIIKIIQIVKNNQKNLNNENLYSKKVVDKSIDEKFHNLLDNSNSVNNFI